MSFPGSGLAGRVITTELLHRLGCEHWVIYCNRMPKKFLATGILAFDFELIIGGRCAQSQIEQLSMLPILTFTSNFIEF